MTIPNNWAKDAACQETTVDFYSHDTEEKKKAKAICRECPVKLLCLQNAMNSQEIFGVWGETDELERRKNLAVNALGEPHVSTQGKIRCGNCGPLSTRYLKVVERKRTRTHLECTNCGLDWWCKKLINKRGTNF